MEVKILIDTREPNAQAIKAALQKAGIPCSVESMKCGDFALVVDSAVSSVVGSKRKAEELEPGRRYVALVERKTFADLDSSIIDKRYSSQCKRMLDTGVPLLFYLYTGNVNWAERFEKKQAEHVMRVISAMLHSSLKIRSVYAFDDKWICHFLLKLRHYAAVEGYLSPAEASHVKTVSVKQYEERGGRKKLLDQTSVYREQLAVIHGLPASVADEIVARYPTMYELLTALKEDKRALSNIPRAGKKTCDKIRAALLSTAELSSPAAAF